MHKLKSSQAGFTLIELLVVVLVLAILGTLGVVNIRNVRAQNRDKTAKTDINTLTFYLESSYEKNGFYPAKLSAVTLPGIDTAVLIDKNNVDIATGKGLYRYFPHECGTDGKCKRFDLEAELEKEAPFEKQSLNQ